MKKSTIWLIDIDGTVCEDIPNEESYRFRTALPLPGSLAKVQELYERGDRVTFFTLELLNTRKILNTGSKSTGFHSNQSVTTSHG